MGVLSQSAFQAQTDRIAALLKAELAARDTEQAAWTAAGFRDALATAAAGDPDLFDYLAPSALALDRRSLPASYYSAVNALLNETSLRSYVARLVAQPGSSSGDGSSFAAYLAEKSITLHPLVAEALRPSGAVPAANVFCPNYVIRFPDRVYSGTDGGSLTDLTAAAGNATTADMTGLWAANGDAVYAGSRYPSTGLALALSTLASGTITPAVQYYNGNAWVAVAGLTDSSVGFTLNDRLKWTQPTDWEPSNQDASGAALADKARYYYIRISRGNAVLTTPPVGTCLTLVPGFVPLSANSARHLGVDQPPLALLRFTADNTVAVEVLNAPDIQRFLAPAIRLRALTPLGANATFTISYTNQSAADQTQAQSSWTSPAALATKTLALNGADTGVNAIKSTGWAVVSTGRGVVAVEVVEARTPAL